MTDIEREKFSGGVAVITGAGSGIGAALARHIARLQMKVVVADISGDNAEKVVKDIREAHGIAKAYTTDVTNPADVEGLAKKVVDEFGDIRLLINNAGVEAMGFTWETSPTEWSKLVSVNILGIVNCLRAFVPHMLKNNKECWISNVASQAAFDNLPGQGGYCVTKHAVQSLTECLYIELSLKSPSIHVSSVIPGMVKTGIFEATRIGKDSSTQVSRYREKMASLMMLYGQPVDHSASEISRQIAANQFWVFTHRENAANVMKIRATYLQQQTHPQIVGDASRALQIWQSCGPDMM